MATMNVSLPDPMKAWVEGQADTGKYSNSSDYVRDLIRRDQERMQKIANMQKLVTEAVEGGDTESSPAEILAEAQKIASQT